MKFSENWLRTICNPKVNTHELSHALTMAGLEVEEILPACKPFSKVVVGQVLTVSQHPKADRLKVCEIMVGENTNLSIICGAANVIPQMKVACALVGAKLGSTKIKQAKLREVESFGMLCSEKELGISDKDDGIWHLPEDAAIGIDIREYYDLDDNIFSLKLTPNRGDCLSLHGIAREVSAITNTPLTLNEVEHPAILVDDVFPVKIEDKSACLKYSGRIIRNINSNAQTPDYILQRLSRAGVRTISAVVDLTNYVMLEVGQPMHAFDLDKLRGGITVRFAENGEKIDLLNGQLLELSSDMLTINDLNGPVALAGIMGGEESSVTQKTSNLFLESACFSSEILAGKWRKLGFSTDALFRYERGVDPSLGESALNRLSALIILVCGGECGPIVSESAAIPDRKEVTLRVDKCEKVLGFTIGNKRIADALERLNLPATEKSGKFHVKPPLYRFDIECEEDLIEEVARVDGYDNLPAIPPNRGLGFVAINQKRIDEKKIRNHFISREYSEVITYSFVESQWEEDFGDASTKPIFLKNPISTHLKVMRSSLIGSLINGLKFNINRYQERIRIFEISRVFRQKDNEIYQPYCCSGVSFGGVHKGQWGQETKPVDYFDIKADFESILSGQDSVFKSSERNALHPGRSADVECNGKHIGWVGELHPRLLTKYEIPSNVVAFELLIEGIFDREKPIFKEISKFPSVVRDLAVVVEEKQAVGEMLSYLNQLKVNSVEKVDLFDVYLGKGIDKGLKGLAFRVLLQDTNKTLSDTEIDEVIGELFEALEEAFSAKPRR